MEYVPNEDKARLARRGLWEGDFVSPWDWRKGKRLESGSSTASSTPSENSALNSIQLVWCAKVTSSGTTTLGKIISSLAVPRRDPTGAFGNERKLNYRARKVIYRLRNSECVELGGESFLTEAKAKSALGYWVAPSGSTSTASNSVSRVYCYDADNKIFYNPTRCSESDVQISESEYSNQKIDSLSTSSTAKAKLGWCLTRSMMGSMGAYQLNPNIKVTCKAAGGKFFAEKSENLEKQVLRANQAYKVTKLLGGQNSPTASFKKEDLTSFDKTIEVELWRSIENSMDSEEYQIYLDQYPTGAFAKLAKSRIKKFADDTFTAAQSSIPNLDYGDYYALVIGNNQHKYLPNLGTAINDARSVASLLKENYGFEITLLENADRTEILRAIAELRNKATVQDNVLIYYAGHGQLDEAANEGFWLPIDASRDDQSNWIQTNRIVGHIRAMKAKHVMVVADSCFSGTITRGFRLTSEQRTPDWLETIIKKKSRTALTSGGAEPVLDSVGGQNSVFATPFLAILRANEGVLDVSQLFSQLRPKVMDNSNQTPEYGTIHQAGHDGGDFLFVRK
jgi:hypothetical protein